MPILKSRTSFVEEETSLTGRSSRNQVDGALGGLAGAAYEACNRVPEKRCEASATAGGWVRKIPRC